MKIEVEGPYRNQRRDKMHKVIGWVVISVIFAGIGVMLAWRG